MKTVKYISHKFSDNNDEIKALALYFDNIEVIEQGYIHIIDDPNEPIREEIDENGKRRLLKKHPVLPTTDFTSEEFRVHLQPLVEEGIVEFSTDFGESILLPKNLWTDNPLPTMPVEKSRIIMDEKYISPKNENNELYYVNNSIINNIFKSQTDLLRHCKGEIEYVNEEINKAKQFLPFNIPDKNIKRVAVSDALENIAEKHKPKYFEAHRYFGKLVTSFIDHFQQGENTLTTSKYLHEILKLSKDEVGFNKVQQTFRNEFRVDPFFVYEAIKLSVPNISKYPTHEVLEFKRRSRDELEAFTAKIDETTFDLLNNYDAEYIFSNAQKIAEIKIKPLIEDISSRVAEHKVSLFRSVISEAKDPKSYSPLLLTLSNNVSNTLALLASLGFITINTALEYYSQLKKTKKDGIYYLFKASKYFA